MTEFWRPGAEATGVAGACGSEPGTRAATGGLSGAGAGGTMRPARVALACLMMAAGLGLAGCDPYDPGQRALGGGAIGAGAGAGIAGLTGGNSAVGALLGGAVGAIGGAATTPPPPRYYDRQPGYYN